MSAVEFVVRSATGAIQRGFVGGVNGPAPIIAQQGADVSLNLNQSMVQGYRREGDMLQIALTSGDTVVVDNFFDAAGNPAAKLYFSTNSVLQSVSLTGAVDGTQYASYSFVDVNVGKWSPNDDLYYVGAPILAPAPMASAVDQGGGFGLPFLGGLALPLLGLLGAAGAGAVVLGSSETRDQSSGSETRGPRVEVTQGTKESGTVVNGADQLDGATISGKGTAGATVTVTVRDHTETTTVNTDGTWTVVIPADVAGPGTYEETVKVDITNGDGSSSVTQTLKVDTEVGVTFDSAKTGGDGIVNAVEQGGKVTLSGTVDAGSTVVVTVNGTDFTATVTENRWSVELPAGYLAGGEYSQSATVTATDQYGNTGTTTGSFAVDTLVNLTFNASATATDGVVNAVERGGVVTLTGTVDAGSTVTVVMNDKTYTAKVTGTTWTLDLPANTLNTGDYSQSATVSARDAAGNTASVTGSFKVDTIVGVTFNAGATGGDGVVNGAEQSGVVRLQGTTDAGSTVKVTIGGTVFDANVSGTTWTVDLPSKFLPNPMEALQWASVTATDANGNTATTNGSFRVDTHVNALSLSPVTGDNLVNASEASKGITLRGVVEEGSSVMVTFQGITRAATVTGGTWSVTYAAGEVPSGEYVATVRMDAMDAAGNTRTETGTFNVDTTPPAAPLITAYTLGAEDGVRAFFVQKSAEVLSSDVDLHRVAGNGAVAEIDYTTYDKPKEREYNFEETPIPNGSHLVMTATDNAGNATSTLFVLEEAGTNVVNIGNSGYDRFNIEAIDLKFAVDSHLELTASDLAGLSANSDRLVVHGAADDTVTALGATATGKTETIGGQVYDVYAFGSGGSLIIDNDITVVV